MSYALIFDKTFLDGTLKGLTFETVITYPTIDRAYEVLRQMKNEPVFKTIENTTALSTNARVVLVDEVRG